MNNLRNKLVFHGQMPAIKPIGLRNFRVLPGYFRLIPHISGFGEGAAWQTEHINRERATGFRVMPPKFVPN